MLKRLRLAALSLAGSFIGCRGEPPPAPSPPPVIGGEIEPSSVEANDGIEHAFYRNVALDALLKQLPTRSVDFIELDLDGAAHAFALVTVSERAGIDLARVQFETTFTMEDGQTMEKRWSAAKGRNRGKITAFFCLPTTVVGGNTKMAPIGE